MPIKKLELDGIHPANPLVDVITEINENLDAIVTAFNSIGNGIPVVGETGAKGDRGEPGQQGIEGPVGPAGRDGTNGTDGKNGVDGKDGKDGAVGAVGPQGPQGIQGEQGLPGKDGRDGVNGKDGADGLQGIQGPKGDKGEPGIQGASGAKGETGAQGIQGLPGKDGKDGLNGTNGKDGLPGAKGDTGAIGPQGIQGVKGDTGATGPVGTPGAMNTVTYTGPVVTLNALGQTVAQTTFTSSGYPIVCIANGDANPDASRWIQLQWYKDGVAIGNKFHMESSGGNINCHYNIITPDTPTAGTHTYSLRTVGNMSGSWTFGEGGGPQLTFIELSGATGPQGVGVKGFTSGYVDAGQFVTLDNLRFTVTTGGTRGLSCATVSGTSVLAISASYAMINGGYGGNATNWSTMPTYTTTPSSSWFGWSFPNAGDGSTYNIQEISTQRFYRVTLMIGPGYTKNFISIERLG